MTIPIRLRAIDRARCDVCGGCIERNESCWETSVLDGPSVVSIYTCMAHRAPRRCQARLSRQPQLKELHRA